MADNTTENEITETQTPQSEDNRPEYKKKRVMVPAAIMIIFLIYGIICSIHNNHYKSTDDAFVEGHIITVSPRISGPVTKLNIEDNMEVKKGDLLMEIDENDYLVKLKQTRSKVDEAKSALINAENELMKTQSELNFAKSDFKRYSQMYEKGIVSKQDLELSKTNAETAEANNNSAKAKYEELSATVKRLEAETEQDELNLSYTKIYADRDGRITNRSVEEGNYVQTAQPLFAIVPENVWVVANFKETQIANMKKGQSVKIKIDTYGSKTFKGEVESIQRSTGAKSSLFPPENAVGSYVKIVQRVPVKIIFKEDISEYNIVPGMSAIPEVKVK